MKASLTPAADSAAAVAVAGCSIHEIPRLGFCHRLAVKKTTQSSVQVRIRLTIQARLGSLDEVSLALCACSYLQQFCTPRVT